MTITRKNSGTPLIGEVYQGSVVKVMPFGAFVNFGFPQDGLVHISEISTERVENISNALTVGDQVSVKLIGFDREGRSKLSIKQAGPGNDRGAPAPQPVFGEVYDGTVVKIMEYGAFVDYGFSRDGMVHISEITAERLENIEQSLKEGAQVKVRFLGFDSKGRTKLSIKQAVGEMGPQPEIGEVYPGTVMKVMPFGAFVNFGFTQDGMVHISEMTDEVGPHQDAQDILSVGDKVEVKFMGFDERGRTKLGML